MASCVKYYSQILMSSLALSLVGCATLFPHKNPDYDPSKSHHRPDGYANRYSPRSEMKGLWRWQWERLRDGLPKPPFAPVLGVPADLRLIHGDSVSPRLTWIGHATVLLQVDGLNLLTDPHWGERASPFSFAGPKRHQPPGLPLELLPPIHAVVISHNHWDHLDRDTLQMLIDRHPSLRFYVPLGLSPWFASNIRGAITSGAGRNVFAVDWDESAEISGRTKVMELRFLPFNIGALGASAIDTNPSGEAGRCCTLISDSGLPETSGTRRIPVTSVPRLEALIWRLSRSVLMSRDGSCGIHT